MERSPWEADSRSAAQEIPCPLHNPKVQHSVHKNPNCTTKEITPFYRFAKIWHLTFEKGNNSNNGNEAVT